MALGAKSKTKAEAVDMRVYRFCGKPTPEQEHMLWQNIGGCRFLWNRMLFDNKEWYEAAGETVILSPAAYKAMPELSWLRELDSLALANVHINFDATLHKYLKGKCGQPRVKKKHKCKDSYTTNIASTGARNIRLDGNMLRLPKVPSAIQLCLHRPIEQGGTLKKVAVEHEPCGKWYFSLFFEYQKKSVKEADTSENCKHIGIDMSLPKLYIDSSGNEANFCKPYKALQERIGKEQRKLSRMIKGSNNYEKQCERIARLCAKAKHQRNDRLHKLSYHLTEEYDVISVESLNIDAMKRALKFGKSVSDNGWSSFINMLSYKAERKGKHLVKIDKWFPSSKTCSACGYVHKELSLSDREYICPHCNNTIDRDVQAAINIDREGLRILAELGCTAA